MGVSLPNRSNRSYIKRRYCLRKLFGYEGYAAIRKRNWTVIGLTGCAIGVAADIAQILGDVALYGFWVTVVVSACSALVIVCRRKFSHHFIVPFLSATWMVIVFGGFAVAQAHTDRGDEKGSILATLQRIDDTTQQTKVAIDRTEQKVDEIFERTKFVPECDDRDVYLKVMAEARRLPTPYSNWILRGSTGKTISIDRGVCAMILLFVTGHAEGKMTEVNITYTTEDDVSISGINAIKTPAKSKWKVILQNAEPTTLHGIAGPEESVWFYVDVVPGKKLRLEVGPDFKAIAATVLGVGDMRQNFEFVATKKQYEFLVSQLFRSVTDEEFWIRVQMQ